VNLQNPVHAPAVRYSHRKAEACEVLWKLSPDASSILAESIAGVWLSLCIMSLAA